MVKIAQAFEVALDSTDGTTHILSIVLRRWRRSPTHYPRHALNRE